MNPSIETQNGHTKSVNVYELVIGTLCDARIYETRGVNPREEFGEGYEYLLSVLIGKRLKKQIQTTRQQIENNIIYYQGIGYIEPLHTKYFWTREKPSDNEKMISRYAMSLNRT